MPSIIDHIRISDLSTYSPQPFEFAGRLFRFRLTLRRRDMHMVGMHCVRF